MRIRLATGPAVPGRLRKEWQRASTALLRGPRRLAMAAALAALLVLAIGLALFGGTASPAAGSHAIDITEALSVDSAAARFPTPLAAGQSSAVVSLPDDWSRSRPGHGGSVWYRVGFDANARADARQTEPLALSIERVCSHFEVHLNGSLLHGGARGAEPSAGNCEVPQLVVLPVALLVPQGNVLDVRVVGQPLQRVASRQRAGGLSALRVGPLSELAVGQDSRQFWRAGVLDFGRLLLLVMGGFILALAVLNPREAYLRPFSLLLIGWAVLSSQPHWAAWVQAFGGTLDSATLEFVGSALLAPVVAMAVQFLLRYAGFRSPAVDKLLLAQCLLLPATLLLFGTARTFVLSHLWYAVLAVEVVAALLLYGVVTWRTRPDRKGADFWLISGASGVTLLLALAEWLAPLELLPVLRTPVLQLALPVLFVAVGWRLLQTFGRALQDAETGRADLDRRIAEATAEVERNYAQLSELRVEQVTEKERKRIAADLHDDLGAKLLTIVHTSESDRISTLAREALEEMRLSVRGLTGRPVRLADALADWRAEVVSRLGQANIEADWRSPTEEISQQLPARAYVQTTRILREAVSNIIKHSGASHCKVRTTVGANDFGLMVQDNGKGIPMELDGKLDRGHGMSSMKHRAKQLQGQCLVESGPGYGTVIRVTLPL